MDFDDACNRIEKAYAKISPKLGYRFLYSSKKTFKADVPLLLLATNPGGKNYEKPILSVEGGNAYRTERWDDGGLSTLQKQIEVLFRLLNRRGTGSSEDLMDKTLSANFCFFRSQSWSALEKEEPMKFSWEIWEEALKFLRPRTIITIGQVPYWGAYHILIDDGYSVDSEETFPTNWGKILIRTSILKKAKRRVVIVGLPHLSRFAIFGRDAGDKFFDPVLKLIDR